MKIPLAKGDYLVNGEQHINLFPVWNKTEKYFELHNTEGLELFCTLSGSEMRGLYVISKQETYMYAVAGNKLYKVATDGTSTVKGTLNSSQNRVGMRDNGTELLIVDGPDGYTYNKDTDAFAAIADTDFPGAESVAFLDGFFVTVDENSQIGRSCELYDGTSWIATDFASAEGDPDPLVAVIEQHRELWFFGKVSTEVFYNAGTTGFSFARISGAVLDYGLAAKHSLAKCDQGLFFLARTTSPSGERVVVRVQGYAPQIISTKGINEAIASMTNTANAEGFAYMIEGHSFYTLTFPSDNRTFVYDASEGQWHERESVSGGSSIRWRPRVYAYFNGFHMVGDYSTGKIYKLKSNVYDEDGATIIRKFVTPEATDRDMSRKLGISELYVPMKTGVGVVSGQGSNPQLMMRYSKDGCNTWSNEKTTSFGKIGEYSVMPKFRSLGQGYRWNIECSVSDPVETKFNAPLVVK